MKTIYIHIGMPKTGTSALQLFFAENDIVLKKYNIFCPHRGRLTPASGANHFRLYFGYKGKGHPICPEDIKSSAKEWKDVLNEIKSCEGNRILLSCEAFCLFPIEHLRELKSYLSSFSVKIVYYIRRMDNLLSSWIQHGIKMGSAIRLAKQPVMPLLDGALDRYARIFGRENIIVRPYEKQQFYGGNIFSDFFHYVFDQELTEDFILPECDANPRLCQDALEFKRLINTLPFDTTERDESLPGLFAHSRMIDANTDKAFQDYNIFSPAERLELIEKYAEDNARIALEYMKRADGKMFYDPLPNSKTPWSPYNGLHPDTALKIARKIITEKYPDLDEIAIANKLNLILVKGTMETLLGKELSLQSIQKQLIQKQNMINQLRNKLNSNRPKEVTGFFTRLLCWCLYTATNLTKK